LLVVCRAVQTDSTARTIAFVCLSGSARSSTKTPRKDCDLRLREIDKRKQKGAEIGRLEQLCAIFFSRHVVEFIDASIAIYNKWYGT
jgi:hypothetical protein